MKVVLFGSAEFDVTTIILETLQFAGANVRLKGNGKFHILVKDKNKDGIQDLQAWFNVQDTDLKVGDTEGKVSGEAYDTNNSRITFFGSDSVKVVQCKQKDD